MFVNVGSTYTFGRRRNFKRNRKAGVVVCPSRGQTHGQQFAPNWIGHVTMRLAEVGFPVLAATMGSTLHYGNGASATAVGTTATAANSTYGATSDPVGLVATSIGALAALRYAKANPSNVAALCLLIPCVDLQDLHDVTRTDLAAEIETAHGGSSGYNTYVADENPADHASSWGTIPTQIHYSSDDNQFSEGVIPAFGAAVGAEVIDLGAVGHSPLTVDEDAVTDFLLEHA